MKKIIIALTILISVAALGESSNEEVAALFAKIRAYEKASTDTKRFKSSERQELKKAEKRLRQYLENNYEAIPIDVNQDMTKKDSCINDDFFETFRNLNMFKGVSKEDMDNKIKYIKGEIKELPKEKKN